MVHRVTKSQTPLKWLSMHAPYRQRHRLKEGHDFLVQGNASDFLGFHLCLFEAKF